MAKLKITEKAMNKVLDKLTPSWKGCFPSKTLENAQDSKSSARKFVFGTLMNKKFIKLSKASAGFKVGDVVSLAELYDEESAGNIAGLIIYRLGNSGLLNEPTIAEA